MLAVRETSASMRRSLSFFYMLCSLKMLPGQACDSTARYMYY